MLSIGFGRCGFSRHGSVEKIHTRCVTSQTSLKVWHLVLFHTICNTVQTNYMYRLLQNFFIEIGSNPFLSHYSCKAFSGTIIYNGLLGTCVFLLTFHTNRACTCRNSNHLPLGVGADSQRNCEIKICLQKLHPWGRGELLGVI